MVAEKRAFPGLLHHFGENLVAFEHLPPGSSASAPNLILWIGGLRDTLLFVNYPYYIAQALPSDWTLAQVSLSSAGIGFGTVTLAQDAAELAQAINYFREVKGKDGKIVIFGHSTGSQDVMEYLTGPGAQERPAVEGGVIQAPVSDREALERLMDPTVYKRTIDDAKRLIAEGNPDGIVPMFKNDNLFDAPISATRWLSLAERGGADDKFSTDLSDEELQQTFGKLPAASPLLILFSGDDEFVSPEADKKALVERWIGIAKKGSGRVDEEFSGVVPGASHNLNSTPGEPVEDIVRRTNGFIKKL